MERCVEMNPLLSDSTMWELKCGKKDADQSDISQSLTFGVASKNLFTS